MFEEYQEFLDEMTLEERSIWLYCFVFKNSPWKASQRLKLSYLFVKKKVDQIEKLISFIPYKKDIYECFKIDK